MHKNILDSGYILKLVPARFADRLDIEVREKRELRLSSKFLAWPMASIMLSFAGMEKTQEEQVWGRVIKIRSYVLDILSSG